MARFKDRLPELTEQYLQLEREYERRCEMMWDDMLGEFSGMNGLTPHQEELIEIESRKPRG